MFVQPPAEDARSVIVVVDPGGPEPLVTAHDVGSGWRIDVSFEDRPVDIVALAYGCPLATVGVPAGRQTILGEGQGRPLPETNAVYSTIVEGEEVRAWEQRGSVPQLRIEDRGSALCASLDTNVVNLPAGGAHFLEDMRDGTVLAGTGGSSFIVDAAGNVEPMDPARVPPMSSDVFLASDGDLFVLTPDPCLLLSDDGMPSIQLACSTTTATSGRGFLAGPPVGPDELFVLTGDGDFSRVVAGDWTPLFPNQMTNPGRKQGVLGLGPGHAVAVGPLRDQVLRYRDGRLELEQIRLSELDKPISVMEHPTLGTVVGSNLGVLLNHDGQEWRQLGQYAVDQAKAMAPLGDGILVGGGQGVFVEGRPDGTVCDSLTLVPGDAETMIPFEEGFAILSDTTNAVHVTFVRVRDPQQSCAMPGP